MKYFIYIFCGFISFSSLAIDWVWPTSPTSEPIERKFEITEKYKYTVEKVIKKLPIDLKAQKDNKTFEGLLRKRFDAIKRADYKTWLHTWTAKSQLDVLALNQQRKYTEGTWVKGWEEQFSLADFYIVKKVEYQKYIIVTYETGYKSKLPQENGFELPIVLIKDEAGNWGVSSALKANPLLIYSPWVNDISVKRIKVI